MAVTAAAAGWKPVLFALLVALLALAGGFAVEHFQRQSLLQHERTHVIAELAQARSRLEAVINGNLLAIQGLTAVIAAQPDMGQAEFARIARGLITEDRPLRNIAGARDLVISLMYPVEGNEAAIGLDYRAHPTQSDAVMRAVEGGDTVVAGPLPLVQGGTGLIARQPVFLPPESPNAPRRLWGIVSTVIDIDRLYRLAGLPAGGRTGDLALAIRGRDGMGVAGDPFYGDPAVFVQDPVAVSVSLPGGSWQMAAVPAAGWGKDGHHSDLERTRLFGVVVAAVLAVMAYLLARGSLRLRLAGEEVRESHALFTGFLDNLPAGAFVRDPGDGRVLFANRWLREHLVEHPGECGVGAADDLAALETGPQRQLRELLGRDGSLIHCDTERFLLHKPGNRRLVGGIVMDVTERVETQQRLAANQARLRALFDTLPDLVWLKDPEGVFLACNPRVEQLLGAKESDIVGRRDRDFVDAELANDFRETDLAAIAAGVPCVNEETLTFVSDGHCELVETIKTPVFDEAGDLVGVLGIARDITARRRAEDQLRASTQRLEAAERIAHVGNWDYRVADGGISWSDETYRLFGLAPQERSVDLAWVRSRVFRKDRRRLDAYMAHLLRSRPGEPTGELRYRIWRTDGELRSLSAWVSVDYDDNRRPARFFGTVQDVTEREKMHRDMQARLAELSRWQGVILGREDRILELKAEVNQLLDEQGRAIRYPSQQGAA